MDEIVKKLDFFIEEFKKYEIDIDNKPSKMDNGLSAIEQETKKILKN